jgi:hypothetical protein
MSILSRLFPSKPAALLCPHCEREMADGHDVERCARKRMSRRFFFGVMGGAAVAVAGGPHVKIPTGGLFDPVENCFDAYLSRNEFLTIEQITREMLAVLHRNLTASMKVNLKFDRLFADDNSRIGDTITIRQPRTFRSVAWPA